MTITSLRKPKITYQQLLKEVRALPPRQQQKLHNELWQATGLHFIRPSHSAAAIRRGQRLAKAIQAELAKTVTGTLDDTMRQMRGRSWSS